MKRLFFIALFCASVLCLHAQKISRDYQNQSLSKVLEDLNKATADKTIYFDDSVTAAEAVRETEAKRR